MNDKILSMILANPPLTDLYLDINDYCEILKECMNNKEYIQKPTPPIKKTSGSSGFFWSEASIEYDHHAPQYLDELKEWKKQTDTKSKENKIPQSLTLMGPRGLVNVHLKKE